MATITERVKNLETRLATEITGRAAAVTALDNRLKALEGAPVPPPEPSPPPVDPSPPPPANFPGLNAAIDALPPGGQLTVPPGAYTLSAPLVLKMGQQITFSPGVRVNGTGVGRLINVSPTAHDVTLELGDSVWSGCNNPVAEQGAIYVAHGAQRTRISGGSIGPVTGTVLRVAGTDGVYDDMDIHHAGHLGIHYAFGIRNAFTRINLHENSTATGTSGHESGGAKGVAHRSTQWIDCHVWGNQGPGVWSDSVPGAGDIPADCPQHSTDMVVRGGRYHHNTGAGVFYEVSDGALIEDVVAWDNGGAPSLADPVAFEWGNITISSARRVNVRRCVVRGGRVGINVFAQPRPDSPGHGDIHVLANDFIADGDWVALSFAQDATLGLFDTADASDNRFSFLNPENGQKRFAYGGGYRTTLAQLKATKGGLGTTRYLTAAEKAAVLARVGL